MSACGMNRSWCSPVAGFLCGVPNCPRGEMTMRRGISSHSATRKLAPVFNGLFKYFPDALYEVAELSLEANEKHNPGEPLHWSKDKSSDHDDCILRHMLDKAAGVEAADCTVSVAWRALAALQIEIEEARNS